MLIKLGFNVDAGRILNPTLIFCSNRENYYTYLAQADSANETGSLNWCEYMLQSLKPEFRLSQ